MNHSLADACRALIAGWRDGSPMFDTEQAVNRIAAALAAHDAQQAKCEALAEACEKAIAYDDAIQRHAAAFECDPAKGQTWIDSNELDSLYGTWIDAARAALAAYRATT